MIHVPPASKTKIIYKNINKYSIKMFIKYEGESKEFFFYFALFTANTVGVTKVYHFPT